MSKESFKKDFLEGLGKELEEKLDEKLDGIFQFHVAKIITDHYLNHIGMRIVEVERDKDI